MLRTLDCCVAQLEGLDDQDVRFELLDTPGPNEGIYCSAAYPKLNASAGIVDRLQVICILSSFLSLFFGCDCSWGRRPEAPNREAARHSGCCDLHAGKSGPGLGP